MQFLILLNISRAIVFSSVNREKDTKSITYCSTTLTDKAKCKDKMIKTKAEERIITKYSKATKSLTLLIPPEETVAPKAIKVSKVGAISQAPKN